MRVSRLLIMSTIGLTMLNPHNVWSRKIKTASDQTPQQFEQRLEDLEQNYKALKRGYELKEKQFNEAEKQKAKVKISAEGVSFRSADGNNEISFRGLIQADARFYLNRNGFGPVDTFLLRRVRPYIEGKFAKRFEFKIMPDFSEGKVTLQDAYIDSMIYPELKIRVGKYKEPFGIERLESAPYLHFVERGLPVNLAPNRDLGMMVHGEILDGFFKYQLGVFNGIFDGGSDDFDINNAKDFAGRIFLHPFKMTSVEPGKGLGFGIAGTYGNEKGNLKDPFLPSYKSAGQRTFFNFRNDGTTEGTAMANGTHWRVSPQFYYFYKGFGLLGEYALSNYRVERNGESTNLQNQAWQVQTSYIIGASNSYDRIKPYKPLGWTERGTGAFEFKTRYNELRIDRDAFPNFADPNRSARIARGFGVGFNWHINENVKFMLDYDQTRFIGGSSDGKNQPTENVILNRYQFFF